MTSASSSASGSQPGGRRPPQLPRAETLHGSTASSCNSRGGGQDAGNPSVRYEKTSAIRSPRAEDKAGYYVIAGRSPGEGSAPSLSNASSSRSSRSSSSARSSLSRVSRQDVEAAQAANMPVEQYAALKRDIMQKGKLAMQLQTLQRQKEKEKARKQTVEDQKERAAALAALPKIISL
eukprot:TRINITY_DN35319_c0_g1_i1.p1 TRINITY_DN35319_c0_g1~~TRINITY_DN35319_c0_g1_i1.p1  ORF type:complete len:178 (-),score=20.16 TRINITY_DN35319_c0_g1_i1:356-889(-)